MSFLADSRAALAATIASAAALGAALASEALAGARAVCALPVGALALSGRDRGRPAGAGVAAVAAAFAGDHGAGAARRRRARLVHVGVEQGWWPSPLPECAAPNLGGGTMAERLSRMPLFPSKPCDEPTYVVPGLPRQHGGDERAPRPSARDVPRHLCRIRGIAHEWNQAVSARRPHALRDDRAHHPRRSCRRVWRCAHLRGPTRRARAAATRATCCGT